MQILDLIQWPAMAVTLLSTALVASSHRQKRNAGFWLFLLSNMLWIVWGVHASAWALICLQIGLAALNVRGALKTERRS